MARTSPSSLVRIKTSTLASPTPLFPSTTPSHTCSWCILLFTNSQRLKASFFHNLIPVFFCNLFFFAGNVERVGRSVGNGEPLCFAPLLHAAHQRAHYTLLLQLRRYCYIEPCVPIDRTVFNYFFDIELVGNKRYESVVSGQLAYFKHKERLADFDSRLFAELQPLRGKRAHHRHVTEEGFVCCIRRRPRLQMHTLLLCAKSLVDALCDKRCHGRHETRERVEHLALGRQCKLLVRNVLAASAVTRAAHIPG